MAVMKSSSPAAAALLLATLLLFAAAPAAVAQVPPPEEVDEEPGCPADINNIIVDAAMRRPLSAETLAEFDGLSMSDVFDCVCDNIVDAAGITSASPGAINRLARDVVERLGRLSNNVGECNPPNEIPITQ